MKFLISRYNPETDQAPRSCPLADQESDAEECGLTTCYKRSAGECNIYAAGQADKGVAGYWAAG